MIKTIFNNNIPKFIMDDINSCNLVIKNSLITKVDLVNTVVKYVLKKKGKQFRSLICCLASRLIGNPNDKTYLSSALVEIIHIATLLHDDVVDKSEIRRGWPSVYKIWNNKVAILIGDYMFSRSLISMVDLKDSKSLELFSETAKRLSEGEILQIEKSFSHKMDEDIYFKMIADKTASLFQT